MAILGFTAMWLPAFLAVFGVFYFLLGEPGAVRVGSTAWLLIPLYGPERILPPALVASAVYVVGAVLSGVVNRPWPWVVGALLYAISYDLAMFVLSIDIFC